MSTEIVPIPRDATREQIIHGINRALAILKGSQGGQVYLNDSDGISRDIRGGGNPVSGNFSVKIRSGAGFHLDVRDSTDLASRLRVTDAQVLMSVNDIQIIGTTPRITSDLSNATLANRLLFQSYIVNGDSTVGVIPNGTSTTGGWTAYNNSTPASATVAAILRATSAAAEIHAGSPAASYQPMDFYTNATRQVRIDTAGLVSLTTALAIGANPSATGAGRFANTAQLSWRNAANSADVLGIRVNSIDGVVIGDTTNATGVTLASTGAVTALVGANTELAATTAGVTLGRSGGATVLAGTVTAPVIDPPTIDSQVTGESQAKGYVSFTGAAPPVLGHQYNVSSVTRTSAGLFVVNWNRDFAAATFAVVASFLGAVDLVWRVTAQVAGSTTILFSTPAGTPTDPTSVSVLAFGTLS